MSKTKKIQNFILHEDTLDIEYKIVFFFLYIDLIHIQGLVRIRTKEKRIFNIIPV